MDASTTGDLSDRLDAVTEEARGRVKAFQSEAEKEHREVHERFQKFLPIADRITAIAKEKLERLRERVAFEVKPAQTQTEQFYARSVGSPALLMIREARIPVSFTSCARCPCSGHHGTKIRRKSNDSKGLG